MKKLIALMLAMVMALSLVACGKPAENDNSANDNNTDGDATATRTFVMGVDAEYPPSAIWARTASTPASTWRSTRLSAICWAGICRSSV